MNTREARKHDNRLIWVNEHFRMIESHEFNRDPLLGYGQQGDKHQSHAWSHRWALVAGLPKVGRKKGRLLRQFIPGELA